MKVKKVQSLSGEIFVSENSFGTLLMLKLMLKPECATSIFEFINTGVQFSGFFT